MKIENTKYNFRCMNNDQLEALGHMMLVKGCKQRGYKWLDVSIFCNRPNDYYMYVDSNRSVTFGYGDHVFNRSSFIDNSGYGV